jgi:flagellar motor switch/type III secretory pathway protein FliN
MGKHQLPDILTISPEPFVWPELPRLTEADLETAARMPSQPVVHPFFCAERRGQITFPAALDAVLPQRICDVTVGHHRFRIWTEAALVGTLAKAAGFEEVDDTEIGPETSALVVEFLLELFIDALEDGLGGPISVTAYQVATAAPPPLALPTAISVAGLRNVSLWITGEAGALNMLLAHLAPEPSAIRQLRPLPESLTKAARIIGPQFQIDKEIFDRLAVGDALLLPIAQGDDIASRIVIGDHLTAAIRTTAKGFELSDVPAFVTPKPASTEGDLAMTHETQTTANDMPVTLSIELAQTRIPLRALQELQIGSVLPFGTELPKTVRLLVDDKSFAEAELVQLEQNLAVRLVKLG